MWINDGTARLAALLGMVFAGAAVIVAARIPSAADIAFELNGGNHYAYLRADDGDLAAGKDEVRVWIEATGSLRDASIYISPAAANRDYNNPSYWSMRDRRAFYSTVYSGGVLLGRTLKPGDYVVEISARNGTFVERFTLVPKCAGCAIDQTIILSRVRDGQIVHQGSR